MLSCSLALLSSSSPCPLPGLRSPAVGSGGGLHGKAVGCCRARAMHGLPAPLTRQWGAPLPLGIPEPAVREETRQSHLQSKLQLPYFRKNGGFRSHVETQLLHQISAISLHLFLTSFLFYCISLFFLSDVSSVKSHLRLLGVPVRWARVDPWCHNNKVMLDGRRSGGYLQHV